MARYQLNPVFIEAVQAQTVISAVGDPAVIATLDQWVLTLYQSGALFVGASGVLLRQATGQMKPVNPTDWLVQRPDGNIWVQTDDDFQAAYVAAPAS